MNIDYTNFLLSLCFVVLLIFPCVWLLKRMSVFGSKNASIRIIDKKLVAPGIYIAISKILDKYYILGLSSGSVSLIRIIDDIQEIEQITKLYQIDQSFEEVMTTAVNSIGSKDGNMYLSSGHQNIKKHIEKLENLVIKKK